MVVATPPRPGRVTDGSSDETVPRRRRLQTRTEPARGGPGLPVSDDWWSDDGRCQASRTLRATVTPIAIRISRTSSFFMQIPLRETAVCRSSIYPRPGHADTMTGTTADTMAGTMARVGPTAGGGRPR